MLFQLVMAQVMCDKDKMKNLAKAEKVMQKSKELYGADMVVFPEVFMSAMSKETPMEELLNDAEEIDGPFVTGMRAFAKQFKLWTVFGFMGKCEDPNEGRVYNTVAVVDSEGSLVKIYRKTHMYDAFGNKESDRSKPGDELFDPIDTPFGKIGIFVCYELRFPEISRYQAIKGANIIIVPTAWVSGPLKEMHWETLITSRAIENTVYMVGCNRPIDNNCTGRSIVVDPLGVHVVTGPETEALIPCHIDPKRIEEARKKLPSQLHRRPELYIL